MTSTLLSVYSGIPIIKGENSLGLMRMSMYHVKLKVITGVYQVDKIFIHDIYMYLQSTISWKILEIPMTAYIVVKFVCMMQAVFSYHK